MRTLAGLWQVFQRHPQLFTSSRMRWHFLSQVRSPGTAVDDSGDLCFYLRAAGFRLAYFLLWNEAALPALALLDRILPKGNFLKTLTSRARTFLVMNLAALAAIAVFFVPATRLWNPTRVKTSSK
jgi:hypothetical protein